MKLKTFKLSNKKVKILLILFLIENLFVVIFYPIKSYSKFKFCETALNVNASSIQNLNKYSNNYSQEKFWLFIVITSSPTNIRQRNNIRNTWLKSGLISPSIGYKFVISTKELTYDIYNSLLKEENMYQDLMLFENIIDTYDNLCMKTLNTFKWVSENIITKFVLKTDDDVYISLERLIQIFRKNNFMNAKRLMYAYIYSDNSPYKRGKWKEDQWKECSIYLPYPGGLGYILSFDLVTFISENYNHLKCLHNEDVSVGTWLAPITIQMVHDPIIKSLAINPCDKSFWLLHYPFPVKIMEWKFQMSSKSERFCKIF